MKNALLALLLSTVVSCAAVDKFLGVNDPTEGGSEVRIQAVENGAREVGDMLLPGLGGVLALAAGYGARIYVKRRKLGKAAPQGIAA